MVTNVFAWILLLAAVAAISFLWFGGDANSNWRRVMIEGWIGRAVTLSSLAIRLAVVTQAGAAVAMLASISIEAKSGVALLEVPALSIARYTNTGPIMSTVTFWRNRNVPIFLAVAFLACTTLASQFTSTLLLWDVRSGSVLGFPTQKNLAVGIGLEDFIDDFSKLLVISPNYFTSPPTDFPTFAEWSEEPATLPEHISDTGATVRALLPIVNENDRAGVMDYNGTASLFDARVVCMRPNFTNWKFTMGEKNARGNYVPYGFKGNLALSDDIPESVAEVLRVNGTTPFHCTLDELVTLEGGRAFKVCVPSSSVAAGGLTSRIDPTQNNTLDYRYKDPFTSSSGWGAAINGSKRGWEIDVGHMVLLFDAEAPVNATNLASLIESFPDFVAEGSGVWMDYTSTSRPDNGTRSRSFDTRGLREQLGASSRPMNLSERGVMDLDMGRVDAAIKQYASEFSRNMSGPVTDPNTEWRVTLDNPQTSLGGYNFSSASPTYSFLNDLLWSPHGLDERQLEISIPCRNCTIGQSTSSMNTLLDVSVVTLPPVLNSIIADIIEETDDPALAWQALTTSALRSAYYDWLPTFTTNSTATTTSLIPCQLPRHNRGFFIVIADLVLHALLVIGVFVWFCKATRYMMINDAWHVVAHLKDRDINEALAGVTVANDRAVTSMIRSSKELRKRRMRFSS
ncbi:hypothetical protein GTA08_BOTSDO13421 [Botryosphaeria dothidea]|uniref:Uncharacterized protein n=1 Tax=Botryosphaeria dothidea TaxID=55169 RepID=A0A8H4J2X0_9PEZI|nr:hypothetical protein GTA08_BOTSDO13421 [Botryosphaeria dothidea]